MQILQQQGYSVEMIAGVTSFCAVAAQLKTSLTTMNKPVHIIPASSGISLEQALDLDGTKVLMKSGKAMSQVKETIVKKGLAQKASLVQNCGLSTQVICKDILTASEDTSYFTTIIVKE